MKKATISEYDILLDILDKALQKVNRIVDAANMDIHRHEKTVSYDLETFNNDVDGIIIDLKYYKEYVNEKKNNPQELTT